MTSPEDRKAHREAVYAQQAEASDDFVQATEGMAQTAPLPEPTPEKAIVQGAVARKIDTSENRFHALKFAVATPGIGGWNVLPLANLYLDFLEGRVATTAEQVEAEAQELAKDIELADLTHSYPADEPFVPPLGSGPEGGEMAEAFAAEPEPVVAVADSPLEEELFEPAYANPHADELLAQINAGPADEPVTAEEMRAYIDATNDPEALDAACSPYADEQPEPTFEYVAAAVQEIASPPPPTPDTTDEPELTDEQVERAEERLATQDPIGAAEQRELEPVAALYVNRPRTKWPWMP